MGLRLEPVQHAQLAGVVSKFRDCVGGLYKFECFGLLWHYGFGAAFKGLLFRVNG